MNNVTFARIAAGLVAALALSACGPGIDEADRPSRSEGSVRLLNAAADRASLDLYDSNSAVQTGVVPNTVSGYGRIGTGSVSLGVRATGNAASLASVTTSLSKDEHRTLVASTSNNTLTPTLLGDDEGAPARNTAKLRVFHTALTEAGAVDVFIADSCAGLPASASAALTTVAGLTSYVPVTASTTPRRVCVTKTGDRTDLRLDVPAQAFTDQRIVTLILTRMASGTLLNGLVLDQQGTVSVAPAP